MAGKIVDSNFELKPPRILPSSYSLVIQQFFNNWDTNEVSEELKTTYPTLINLTRMYSFNKKPLSLVRADFCPRQQVTKLLNDGRITIGHMKNAVKQYHPPVKINKCMKCFSHAHDTKECTSPVQLCIRCGLDHPFNNNCSNEIKSVNYGQDHYAGHSACPQVQQIRQQISQNQKIKRTQLLINHEHEQHHQAYNNQTYPPLPSTPIQQSQQQQERNQIRPRSYTTALLSQHQQQTNSMNGNTSSCIENILTAFTNKMEHRLHQLEERLINQVIEIEKKLDNIKVVTDDLETLIFETILPAIKTMQKCSLNNTRNTTSREELMKHNDEITMLLTERSKYNTSKENTKANDTKARQSAVNKSRQTTTSQVNERE